MAQKVWRLTFCLRSGWCVVLKNTSRPKPAQTTKDPVSISVHVGRMLPPTVTYLLIAFVCAKHVISCRLKVCGDKGYAVSAIEVCDMADCGECDGYLAWTFVSE